LIRSNCRDDSLDSREAPPARRGRNTIEGETTTENVQQMIIKRSIWKTSFSLDENK
jgi:hypothetical protein